MMGRPMTAFFQHWPLLASILLLSVLTASLAGATLLGVKIGRRLFADKDSAPAGFGGVEAAVYGLFGLLLAFSFSGAAERFNGRKAMMLREAQSAGTAASRIDLLPEPHRGELRKLLLAYLDGMVTALEAPHDYDGLMKALREAEAAGARLL